MSSPTRVERAREWLEQATMHLSVRLHNENKIAKWMDAFADKEVAEEREACASIAGGWTGEINTVENCAVVSEVCRQVAAAIRQRGSKSGGSDAE